MPMDLFSDRLPYPVSKSHAAFLFTCERLFKLFPKLYFWTFTFKNVYCDWQYAPLFNRIMLDVAYPFRGSKNGGLMGVRVIEHHESHGLHYHLILNERIDVRMLRALGAKYGLGFVKVKRCNPDTAWYLGKYLTQDDGEFHRGGGKTGGVSRWHTVGSFAGVRVRDIELECMATRCMRRFTSTIGQIPFRASRVMYNYGSAFDVPRKWDFKTKRRFMLEIAATLKETERSIYEAIYGIVFADKWGEPMTMPGPVEALRETALRDNEPFCRIVGNQRSRTKPKLVYLKKNV